METWPFEHRVFLYDGHLISCFGDVPWPPRSPDLSTCDFFPFGGYLKSRVSTHKPRMLNDLKEAVRKFVRTIVSYWPVSRTILKKRLENYIQEDGRHLTEIIFKT
jgi:hypothetical protein